MIEYLLLKGLNDAPHDVTGIIKWLKDIPAHINLIPFNPIDGAPELQPTDATHREWYARQLKQAGFRVTLRYSLGADIAAACGQLVQRENRRIALSARNRVEKNGILSRGPG
jgi:23S rRNA (adenine2503-C2)-methyltransferase